MNDFITLQMHKNIIVISGRIVMLIKDFWILNRLEIVVTEDGIPSKKYDLSFADILELFYIPSIQL